MKKLVATAAIVIGLMIAQLKNRLANYRNEFILKVIVLFLINIYNRQYAIKYLWERIKKIITKENRNRISYLCSNQKMDIQIFDSYSKLKNKGK